MTETNPDSGFLEPPSDNSAFGSNSGDASPSAGAGGVDPHRIAEFRRRYEIRGELGAGGMGAVYAVYDRDLRRELAMKFLTIPEPGRYPDIDRQRRARFIEEAQIAAQLEHPSIIPIHDLGLDPDGRIYLTMKQVRGMTLRSVIERMRAGDENWSLPRVLEVMARIGEAVAYAHDKQVIHRDLKPSNIMVGRFGEAYVLDWGLARILGSDAPEEPQAPTSTLETRLIETERHEMRFSDPLSPELTNPDQMLGTAQYMAPEQARAERTATAKSLDIYSLGAILYEILTGRAPYSELGPLTTYQLLEAVREGPPEPIHRLVPGSPAELNAICDKAMARRRRDRYEDMSDFVADLRAYLDNRVVRAHRTGPLTELRLWFVRNKSVAIAVILGILTTLAGAIGFAVQRDQKLRTLNRLLDGERIERLERGVAALSAIESTTSEDWDRWLDEARRLVSLREHYTQTLDALLATARMENRVHWSATGDSQTTTNEIAVLSARIEMIDKGPDPSKFDQKTDEQKSALLDGIQRTQLDARLRAHTRRAILQEHENWQGWEFDDPEVASEFAQVLSVVVALDRLRIEPAGTIRRVEALRDRSRGLDRAEFGRAWTETIAEISDSARSPEYRGLAIRPQRGLMPLGRNPASRLFEFWVMASGERPERAGDGWKISPSTGVILILVPGGTVTMGAQSSDLKAPNFAKDAREWEVPIVHPEIEPYFLSRYELTQGQWERLTGEMRSQWLVGGWSDSDFSDWTNPVEEVSHELGKTRLRDWGLRLPSEAEWEHAARAGGDSISADQFDSDPNRHVMNYRDESADERGSGNDGYRSTAPVDAFPPNEFGFQSMAGNVWEHCEDWFAKQASVDPDSKRGLHMAGSTEERSLRGCSYQTKRSDIRLTLRKAVKPTSEERDFGVRPGRALDP